MRRTRVGKTNEHVGRMDFGYLIRHLCSAFNVLWHVASSKLDRGTTFCRTRFLSAIGLSISTSPFPFPSIAHFSSENYLHLIGMQLCPRSDVVVTQLEEMCLIVPRRCQQNNGFLPQSRLASHAMYTTNAVGRRALVSAFVMGPSVYWI